MAATLILIDALLEQISTAVSLDEAAYYDACATEADEIADYFHSRYPDF
ncbi:MAG: hypothetical protein ACKO7W_06285 [Elainella sp.]